MFDVEFSARAEEDFEFWLKADRRIANKVLTLLEEMQNTPCSGTGKPERLRHQLTGFWSRRIDKKNRIVYEVDEVQGVIRIASLRGHYD